MEFTSNNLTFVIVTFNSRKVIYDCLNSLPKDFHKLIIENSSDEELKKELEQNYVNTRVILSSNIGMGAGNNLGIKNMSSFFKNFSFGSKTGIDMPFESSGVLPSDEWKKKNVGYKWTDGDTVITGIGQGYFLATPLQLAYATSIIANRGLISIPKLNKDIQKEKNKKILEKEEFFKNNLKPEDWEIITNAMFDVVNKQNGTAFWSIRDKKNKIAGKTGTVQVYSLSQETDERDDENIPDHLKDHSLYVAFAPIDEPQIVIATVVENVGSGSKFAAPISNKIINYYLDKVKERY